MLEIETGETGGGPQEKRRGAVPALFRGFRGVRGFTLVEVMMIVAIVTLLAAIAIPNALRGRTTANESAAIENVRALVNALEMYRFVYNAYPNSYQANMYTTPEPDFGPPSFNVTMSGNAIQGYSYTYTSSSSVTYSITANPQTLGTTGSRAFFVDESGTVRHCSGAGPAGPSNNTIGAPPSPTC